MVPISLQEVNGIGCLWQQMAVFDLFCVARDKYYGVFSGSSLYFCGRVFWIDRTFCLSLSYQHDPVIHPCRALQARDMQCKLPPKGPVSGGWDGWTDAGVFMPSDLMLRHLQPQNLSSCLASTQPLSTFSLQLN